MKTATQKEMEDNDMEKQTENHTKNGGATAAPSPPPGLLPRRGFG